MPPHSVSPLAVLAGFGLLVMSAIASDAADSSSTALDPAATTDALRQTCRDGSAEQKLSVATIDVQAIAARHDRALAACTKLIESGGPSGPDLAAVLLDRGDLYGPAPKEYARALADFDRAIALAPTMATAYWRRGKTHLLYTRDLPRALHDLDDAIRLDPSPAAFFVTRASIRGWLGDPDNALADLDRAIAIDPKSDKALSLRAMAYMNKNNAARALIDFDDAIRLAPDDAGLYGLRATARRQAGDDAGANADQARMQELMFATKP